LTRKVKNEPLKRVSSSGTNDETSFRLQVFMAFASTVFKLKIKEPV
jgi:hypothetical protein